MVKYFNSKNVKDCCGCRTCEQICVEKSITMISDKEGFLYPNIDETKCIGCNLCAKHCPMEYTFDKKEPIVSYACQIKDKETLKKSSSGGMFRLFADYYVRQGGLVVGCQWNEVFKAVITFAEIETELYKMQGSKYVSSDTGDTYSKVKNVLDRGREVLYTGTPCQIAGLKAFLQRDYEQLLTMDFLCHGVPSSKMFDASLDYLQKKHHVRIIDYRFRDKTQFGWGLCTAYDTDCKGTIYEKGEMNHYLYGFTRGYMNRYSCYQCPFTGIKRIADVTVADYWGGSKYHANISWQYGCSILLLNTEKAMSIFKDIEENVHCENSTIDNMAEQNGSLKEEHRADTIPKIRKTIYKQLYEEGFSKLADESLTTSKYKWKRMLYSMPRWLYRVGQKINSYRIKLKRYSIGL